MSDAKRLHVPRLGLPDDLDAAITRTRREAERLVDELNAERDGWTRLRRETLSQLERLANRLAQRVRENEVAATATERPGLPPKMPSLTLEQAIAADVERLGLEALEAVLERLRGYE